MAAIVNLTNKGFIEGDDVFITWSLTQGGSVYDLSSVTKVWFTAKADQNAADDAAEIGLNSTDNPIQVTYGGADPGAGKIRVWLDADSTRGLSRYQKLFYDLQMLDDGYIRTPVKGELRFDAEITKAQE